MTEIQQKFKDVIAAVYKEKYFVVEFEAALADHKMTVANANDCEYTDNQIVNMCNDFWEGLPDSPAIRRPPFFQLCDIAENIFDM